MEIINNLLSKYKKLLINSKKTKTDIKKIIYQETEIDLNENSIEVKADNLYLICSPALKNELFIQQNRILKSIKQNTNLNISQIKFR